MVKKSKKSHKHLIILRKPQASTRNKILISAIVILLIIGIIAYVSTRAEAAASVNGEKILTKRVDALYDSLPKDSNSLTKAQILQRLIDTKVLVDYAEKKGYGLTEEEFKVQLQKLLTDNKLTEKELETELALRGATLDDVRDNIIVQNFVNGAVIPQTIITAADIAQYRSKNITPMTDAEITKILSVEKQKLILNQIVESHKTDLKIIIYKNY